MSWLIDTDESWSAFIIRMTLGVVMFPHGAQKMLGWYGGNGFSGTMGFFTEQMGLPAVIAFLVIIGEFFGSLGLLIGFFTRVTAPSLSIIMAGAIAMVHQEYGFFMNWFGQQSGEGYEYHLLVIGMCLALTLTGAGKWSVDGAIGDHLRS